MTTTSAEAGKSHLFLRNTSRIRRLIRFRATLPPYLRLTAIPSLVLPSLFFRCSTSRLRVRILDPRPCTRRNSWRLKIRAPLGNDSSWGSLVARQLDRESGTTLLPPPLDDFPATAGPHPCEEAVLPPAFPAARLIRPLQSGSPLSDRRSGPNGPRPAIQNTASSRCQGKSSPRRSRTQNLHG